MVAVISVIQNSVKWNGVVVVLIW